jgi:hypothetical protein
VINLSTNYEQQPDGFYRQARVCIRADHPDLRAVAPGDVPASSDGSAGAGDDGGPCRERQAPCQGGSSRTPAWLA